MNDAKLPTTPDIPKLSEHILTVWYNTADEAQALRDFARDTECDLSDAIYADLRDMLHNGNAEDIFDTTNMTDADIDALSSRFHDDADQLTELSDFIATLINTHYTI